MNKPQDPWAITKTYNITVTYTGSTHYAGLHQHGTIYLAKGLTEREERSVLAHELGHYFRGETHIWADAAPKAEAAADLYAAELLIDEAELNRLARCYPDEPGRIAYELGVADWVLDAWVRAYPLADEYDEVA